MRSKILLLILALVFAACGGTDSDGGVSSATAAPTTAAPAQGDTEAPATTATEGGSSTSAASQTTAPVTARPATEGPAAPAFTTVLSDGTEFSLAAEANPVYLIFWAEW